MEWVSLLKVFALGDREVGVKSTGQGTIIVPDDVFSGIWLFNYVIC